METFWVDFDVAEKFMIDVFKSIGVPKGDAEICSDVLITADKFGIDSHGIGRLKNVYYDRIKKGIQSPITKFKIIKESSTTAAVDGHNGMGQVISKKAMQIAIKKAYEYGIGMVVANNSTHYGMAGYYALMAEKKDMIGITGTNARSAVAPTFGVENILGTNPLTFAIPSDEEFPFCLDCATSMVTRGKIELYERMGKKIPKGWVIGMDGKDRVETKKILKDFQKGRAALVPLGGIGEENVGYKGYGYATVVEILSAALTGGKFFKMLSGIENGKEVPINLGHFFIAINISSFVKPELFKKTTGDILRAIRSSKKAPGQTRIYTAGEKEYLTWIERKNKGIPINKNLLKQLIEMQKELGLNNYSFYR